MNPSTFCKGLRSIGVFMGILAGKKALVTAGPTWAALDSLRFITNRATGRLEKEIALELLRHDTRVTFLYGRGSVTPEKGASLLEVETVEDLLRTVRGLKGETFNLIIHAMAVLDFVPDRPREGKVSSQEGEWEVRLVRTPKVIKTLRELWPSALLVGFKLEVGKTQEELITIGRSFLSTSGADLLVVNDLTGITEARHRACVLDKDGELVAVAETKKEIATKLVDLVEKRLAEETRRIDKLG
jgi:phosphopantothenoylcysteine synthetase/decarboxylase